MNQRYYQEHEQERASILAVTSTQAAVTFPESVATALETADRHGQREYLQDLSAASDNLVLIDDEPMAHDWIRLEDEATDE